MPPRAQGEKYYYYFFVKKWKKKKTQVATSKKHEKEPKCFKFQKNGIICKCSNLIKIKMIYKNKWEPLTYKSTQILRYSHMIT